MACRQCQTINEEQKNYKLDLGPGEPMGVNCRDTLPTTRVFGGMGACTCWQILGFSPEAGKERAGVKAGGDFTKDMSERR